MTVEPRCWGGGEGVSHPLQLITGLVIKSVTTSPTLAGEHMLLIPKVSILLEQSNTLILSSGCQKLTNFSAIFSASQTDRLFCHLQHVKN